ncbi:MAG TPA: hypothetical protein VGL02_05375 [Streptomyces sp.]
MERSAVLIDAPSNLGLRPPVPGAVPGCATWGLHLTIYDPDLDPEGTGAVLLADLLTDCTGFAQP